MEQHYCSGALKKTFRLLTGVKQGPKKKWFENGQLFNEAAYVNSKRDGLEQWWDKSVRTKVWGVAAPNDVPPVRVLVSSTQCLGSEKGSRPYLPHRRLSLVVDELVARRDANVFLLLVWDQSWERYVLR